MTDAAPPRSVDPNTTAQEDLTTAGQRRINLIWEYTQALIAITITIANVIVGVYQGIATLNGGRTEFPIILSSSFFLIVGFYFSRTNHAAIGGIGHKPAPDAYRGR